MSRDPKRTRAAATLASRTDEVLRRCEERVRREIPRSRREPPVVLGWTDNSSNETGFTLERATSSGFTQGLTAVSVGANVTTLTQAGRATPDVLGARARCVLGLTGGHRPAR
jgi:hypothetical protein